ncbi:helix-turn-helix domain-containing protein [Paenibacillus glucanolyticus]|uniref:helix-turn-helix domain-containing protein n=1 Tax=Paenibacillus glucanolyticus TaxID=59843 RepID=UPI00128BF057|nr:helix-turn-helix transcriptional regulator [Paenibacillus glucanolyticus]MPY15820.1 helix-turn-helix domain-containing protein [Paenibacillus glucanolyticus]
MQITLRMARENRGMSVEEAAKRAGITPTFLKKLEQNCGKERYVVVDKLLSIYGIHYWSHLYVGSEDDWEKYCIKYLEERANGKSSVSC